MNDEGYVPSGRSVLTPYVCPRECAAAIAWYVDVFGAVEQGERYLESDARIAHAELNIDGALFMLSDAFPDYGADSPPSGNRTATFALHLYVPDADVTVASAQAAGADVQRPVEAHPVAGRLGTFMDPFGIRWMVATHAEEVDQASLDELATAFPGAEPGPLIDPS